MRSSFLKFVLSLSLLSAFPATAQWQTPQYSIPVGRGTGFTGFNNAAPGTAGNALTSNGPAANPSFQSPLSGFFSSYDTVTALQAATVNSSVNGVQVLGYLALGDGGAAQYTRTVGPAGNGKVQSTDGAWWIINEPQPNELQFGAVTGASNAAQTAAIQAMLNFCTPSVCRKVRINRAHTITSGLTIPSNLVVEFATGTEFSSGAILTKGFNGDMITLSGSGTTLINPFLNGSGATFTGRGIVCGTGAYHRVYNAWVFAMESAALDFPTDTGCTEFNAFDGLYQRQTVTDPSITFPLVEALTNGYRRFWNISSGGGTLFKFNNGNITQVFGGDSAGLDYSATTTGRVSVVYHRCACAITIFGTEGHFVGNTIGTSLTIGAGTSLYDIDNNVIAGGAELTDSSGTTNNRIGVTLPNPGTNDQIIFGRTGNQPLYRTVTGDITFSAGVSTIGANKVTYSKFQQASAGNVVLANATAGAANYAEQTMPSCSTSQSALKWTSNTGFGCQGFGSSVLQNTGTSGANIGLLNGNNTYSGSSIFSGTVEFDAATNWKVADNIGVTVQTAGGATRGAFSHNASVGGYMQLNDTAAAASIQFFGIGGGVYKPMLTFGSATAATGGVGEVGFAKITASGSAPGAAFCKVEWVTGTSGGTCKMIAYCGTSTTATTIIDNVGGGC